MAKILEFDKTKKRSKLEKEVAANKERKEKERQERSWKNNNLLRKLKLKR